MDALIASFKSLSVPDQALFIRYALLSSSLTVTEAPSKPATPSVAPLAAPSVATSAETSAAPVAPSAPVKKVLRRPSATPSVASVASAVSSSTASTGEPSAPAVAPAEPKKAAGRPKGPMDPEAKAKMLAKRAASIAAKSAAAAAPSAVSVTRSEENGDQILSIGDRKQTCVENQLWDAVTNEYCGLFDPATNSINAAAAEPALE